MSMFAATLPSTLHATATPIIILLPGLPRSIARQGPASVRRQHPNISNASVPTADPDPPPPGRTNRATPSINACQPSGAAPVSNADVSTLETTTPSPSVQPSRPAPTYRQHQPVSLLLSSPSADRPPIACQSCFRSSTPKSLKCRFDHVLQCFRSSTPKSLGVELTTSSTSLYVPVQPPSNRTFHQRLERRKAHPSVLRPPFQRLVEIW